MMLVEGSNTKTEDADIGIDQSLGEQPKSIRSEMDKNRSLTPTASTHCSEDSMSIEGKIVEKRALFRAFKRFYA
jgi:hypothetical protein